MIESDLDTLCLYVLLARLYERKIKTSAIILSYTAMWNIVLPKEVVKFIVKNS